MGVGETIGARAKSRRKKLGLRMTDVVKRVRDAGRSQTTIQNIRQLENEEVNKITYLAELSIALEADPIWLATGKKAPEKRPEINRKALGAAWDAARVIIDEHDLDFDHEDQMILALRIYFDLSGNGAKPQEVAKEALLQMLADRQSKSKS